MSPDVAHVHPSRAPLTERAVCDGPDCVTRVVAGDTRENHKRNGDHEGEKRRPCDRVVLVPLPVQQRVGALGLRFFPADPHSCVVTCIAFKIHFVLVIACSSRGLVLDKQSCGCNPSMR
eukprot:607357-Prorocentrum_minimum.AAC.2